MSEVKPISEISADEMEAVDGGMFWPAIAAGVAGALLYEVAAGFVEGLADGFTNGR